MLNDAIVTSVQSQARCALVRRLAAQENQFGQVDRADGQLRTAS
jgi:hypothetical protein